MSLALALALLALVATAAAAPLAPAPPAGFVVRPLPASGSSEWSCANHADAWDVSLENGRLRPSPAFRGGPPPVPLPFTPVPGAGETLQTFLGARHLRRVSDGYLVGFDRGEFGGGLYWFSADGGKHRAVAPADTSHFPLNVQAMETAGATVYVFQGLAHLTRSRGRVLAVKRDGGKTGWTATVLADLDAAPAVVTAAGPDAWLVVLSRGVARVDRAGKVERLWTEGGLGSLYPSSIVQTPDGTIYIGMRAWIARMSLAPSPPKIDLLAPAGCRHLVKKEEPSGNMRRGLFGNGEKPGPGRFMPCRCAAEPGGDP